MENIRNNRLNKGLAFTHKERQVLGLQGLLPPAVHTIEKQTNLVLANIRRLENDLDKYVYLMHLLDRNEKLFYHVLSTNVDEIMPVVYTPTVGEACIKYGFIFTQPKGLFISINDKGHVFEVLQNWPHDHVKVIVVTDGERILGLGDLGANGMGIPVGKLALYTALAGVNPAQCLPITLDVGTNNEAFLKDDYYLGLRQRRTTGEKYHEFIEEFVYAVKKRFGGTCLIQWEDFANANAFAHLNKFQMKCCCFNDDIQGTASVALSGILTAVKMTNTALEDNTYLFYGAGEAAIGTADLIVLGMTKKGLTKEEARKKIWLIDSKGLIVKDRPEGGINHEKAPYAKEGTPCKSIVDVINIIKPTALIGCAAQGRQFTKEVIEAMAKHSKRPIIFALSNPTSKAECTAEEAYTHTDGQAIFASGSPFNKVEYKGKTFYPGQGNNCYIFPAVGLAVTACNIKHITDEFFLIAAESLTNQVSEAEMNEGRTYPKFERIQQVSLHIAVDVAKYAISQNLVHLHPMPECIEEHIKSHVYHTAEYNQVLKSEYEYPKL